MGSVFFLYILPWLVCFLISTVESVIASLLASSWRDMWWDYFRKAISPDLFTLPHRIGLTEVGVFQAIIGIASLIGLSAASNNGLSLPSYWAIPLIFWLCVTVVGGCFGFLYGYTGGRQILGFGVWLVGMALTVQYLIHQYGRSSSFIAVLKILILAALTGAAICFAKFLISQRFPSQSSLNQQEQTGKTSDFLGIVASLVGIVSALVGLFPTLLDLGRKLGIIP